MKPIEIRNAPKLQVEITEREKYCPRVINTTGIHFRQEEYNY
jgi:hypothetical protein